MESRIFGYARVSSKEQNLDRQILALKQYVPEDNILVDKASGANLQRPSYQALKGALGLRKGDILYITSLDRLSRNKEGHKKGVTVVPGAWNPAENIGSANVHGRNCFGSAVDLGYDPKYPHGSSVKYCRTGTPYHKKAAAGRD